MATPRARLRGVADILPGSGSKHMPSLGNGSYVRWLITQATGSEGCNSTAFQGGSERFKHNYNSRGGVNKVLYSATAVRAGADN